MADQLVAAIAARGGLPADGPRQLREWQAPLRAAVQQRLAEGWTGEELTDHPTLIERSLADAAHAGRVLTSRLHELGDIEPPASRSARAAQRQARQREESRREATREAAATAARDQALADIRELEAHQRRVLTLAARRRGCVPSQWADDHPRVRDAEVTLWQVLLADLGGPKAASTYLAEQGEAACPAPTAPQPRPARDTAASKVRQAPARPPDVSAVIRLAERCGRERTGSEALRRLIESYPPEVQHQALERYAKAAGVGRLASRTAGGAP